MPQQTRYFGLGGEGVGLDLVTPPIERRPNAAYGGRNYMPRPEGYVRFKGFERFDGRPLASAASYWVLNFDAGTATIAEGATVTGAASGATGKALIAMVVESGSFGSSNAAGYLVLTTVSGTFQDNENLQVTAVTKCVANGTATERGALTDANDTTWIRDAIETARALTSTVTGSGVIRGGFTLGSTKYVFRNNAGGTACVLYKSTTSGWTAVDLGREVSFTSGGTYVIAEGDTITGAISGATATVKRVIVTSGSFAGGDAAGRLILASQTGTFQAENLNVGATLNVATIAGNSSAITLSPSGRFETVRYNFRGSSFTARIYGCDGVNKAFEFDGTTFVPIVTGMTTDTPDHIAAHLNYLVLSFPGGSVQFSSLGDPYTWSVTTGAGEIGIGDEVTGLLGEYKGTLVIFSRNRIGALFGPILSEATLETISNETGAIEWSVQQMVQPIWLDDRGIRNLAATQAYGDFEAGTMSRKIKPLLDQKRKAGATVTASVRVREFNEYLLFFDDDTGIVMNLSGKEPAFMPLDFGMTVNAAWSAEDSSGNEEVYFSSDNGYVYKLNSDTSFDGSELSAAVRLGFDHLGSPKVNKRFHKLSLEVNAGPNASIRVHADYSYGNPDIPALVAQDFTVRGGGGYYNQAVWNDFYWSAQVEGLAEAHIEGLGTNISPAFYSYSTYEDPHTLHGLTISHSVRGLQR